MHETYATIARSAPRGRIVGELAQGEDVEALVSVLLEAPELALAAKLPLLVHAHDEVERHAQRERQRTALRQRRLGRYVLLAETARGARVIKVAEVRRLGNALLGACGTSTARREHRYHRRASALELAATRSCGYLEWRHGPRLLRACQIQTLLDPALECLQHVLPRELSQSGDAALEPLAEALAAMHAKRFFHADLKPFHAFVVGARRGSDGLLRYELRWIDLGRVSFRLSRRQRIINLYQALRFLVPPHPEAHARFVRAYAKASGWYAHAPERALAVVQRFLAYKYITHPVVR